MKRGDLAVAWQINDAVLARRLSQRDEWWQWPRHVQPVWTGAPLQDRHVLVRCYHGLGDTLQFLRFAAPLRKVARRVSFWVQPSLVPLVTTAPGIDTVLPLHDGSPAIDFEVDVEIMELPHALRATPDMIAEGVPYLFPRPPLRTAAGALARIGFVWRAGTWDPQRSIPAQLLAPLGTADKAEHFSFQMDAIEEEVAALDAVDSRTANIEELATRILSMDLVITVDTFVAHLAGALGVPTWTLLHSQCDWRWMQRRSDTPWYPAMRLFRQNRPGDWEGVVDEVRLELVRSLGQSRSAGVSVNHFAKTAGLCAKPDLP